MKVTKEMLHKDIQPYFFRASMFSLLFRTRWAAKMTAFLTRLSSKGANVKGLDCDELYIPSSDGKYQIRTRVYKPLNNESKLPIMVYYHGGGYLIGTPETFNTSIEKFIQTRPCIVIAPDYRKSFTEPFPAGFNDCYDTLLWANANAEKLGGHADNIILAGHSAGGGMTAAVTLKARDTQDVKVAFQMPIYPMIDCEQPNDPEREMHCPSWDTKANAIGWGEYLSNLRKENKPIPAYASPSKNTDYSGFPPTITFVGVLEPFYQETVKYVEQLKQAGIDVAFKEYEGCVHGFEIVFTHTDIGKDAYDYTYESYAEFYDKYALPTVAG